MFGLYDDLSKKVDNDLIIIQLKEHRKVHEAEAVYEFNKIESNMKLESQKIRHGVVLFPDNKRMLKRTRRRKIFY